MDIYIFSDESGVFDRVHNDIFVFGGILFFSKEEKNTSWRKYVQAEKTLRQSNRYEQEQELKATSISTTDKGKMFRAVSHCQKFGVVIRQNQLLDRIFLSKKDKQRYLDYAYKIGLKRLFEYLGKIGRINLGNVLNVYIFVDEHTTATNGIYELREAIEQEFKYGTYNRDYSKYFLPICENLQGVSLKFCDSAKKALIRAADIVANKLYYTARTSPDKVHDLGIFVVELP